MGIERPEFTALIMHEMLKEEYKMQVEDRESLENLQKLKRWRLKIGKFVLDMGAVYKPLWSVGPYYKGEELIEVVDFLVMQSGEICGILGNGRRILFGAKFLPVWKDEAEILNNLVKVNRVKFDEVLEINRWEEIQVI